MKEKNLSNYIFHHEQKDARLLTFRALWDAALLMPYFWVRGEAPRSCCSVVWVTT